MTPSLPNPFVGLVAEGVLPLPGGDRFVEAGHIWNAAEIDALILAWAARRPLLIRGEAGSGKSQVARAAARVLGGALLVEVIHPRFEAQDLLYRQDVVARLADAQINQIDATGERYLSRGPLWQAMEAAEAGTAAPVLLIDEVDKADSDLPNALLEVLGNRSFPRPPPGTGVVRAPHDRPPLIIFTTNEERELPAAFVRRCVVLNVNPPADDAGFITWLVTRGRVHQTLQIADAAREIAARQVLEDRKTASAGGFPKVGLAEYIDLLTALHDLTQGERPARRDAAQSRWLQRLSAYALIKNAGQDQQRPPVDGAMPA